MTHVINKKLVSLSFLSIAIATHCMENNNIQNNNSKLTLLSPEKRYKSAQVFAESTPDIALVLYKENYNHLIAQYKDKIERHKDINYNGYSLLSFAAINYHPYPSQKHLDICKAADKYTPEQSSYEHRKDVVRFLLENGFVPTKKDRYVARKIEQEAGILHNDNKSDLLDQLNQ